MHRLVSVRNENTKNSTGLCLDPYDLCTAKLIAGRPKDHAFVFALVDAHLIQAAMLVERIQQVDQADPRREGALAWAKSLMA